MNIEVIIFMINLSSTLIMCGAIWLAQLSTYPLLSFVGKEGFPAYELEHIRRITPIAWTMINMELISGGLLLVLRPVEIPFIVAAFGFMLTIGIWCSTRCIQCPLHHALTKGFCPELHAKLLKSNLHRTMLWTTRSILVLGMLGVTL